MQTVSMPPSPVIEVTYMSDNDFTEFETSFVQSDNSTTTTTHPFLKDSVTEYEVATWLAEPEQAKLLELASKLVIAKSATNTTTSSCDDDSITVKRSMYILLYFLIN